MTFRIFKIPGTKTYLLSDGVRVREFKENSDGWYTINYKYTWAGMTTCTKAKLPSTYDRLVQIWGYETND